MLSPEFDAAEALAAHARAAGEAIAEVLLNQRVVAGIGNIFKSETLFLAAINPFALVSDALRRAAPALLTTAQRLLAANVLPSSAEGIATYFGLRRTTGRAIPTDRLWVYGRGSKPCRHCGTPIASSKHGTRRPTHLLVSAVSGVSAGAQGLEIRKEGAAFSRATRV